MSPVEEVHYSNGKLWIFTGCELYNVLPFPSAVTQRPEDIGSVRLFAGDLYLQELFETSNENRDMTHKFQLNFIWNKSDCALMNQDVLTFCSTDIISDYESMAKNIVAKRSFYQIRMNCDLNVKILLELRFIDVAEMRKFRDVIFRINEEFEILADMEW
ncbi:hypothetical protein TPHA_0J01490 [Tetrapisispora phaffii CBS 4417]|uniref:Uncharacterized protein n=1 Tax=Tetrapisispora phaffii (strain ATCC 24235 / CBS 4417 / NBRC 1672 / NRRL Y-8282 / UCD 70-5) TaxID=1071381 RepID=G8BYM8_TETPH|nr:hypothetical protein TPHA_0J01490 [Tetrapisispora phaffii CBS 4417]CCE64970.1 hypothetical protein TPHA_0J01490 [Tetrapisispora phaffii CBS 4417]